MREWLKRIRREKRLTQKTVSKRLDISESNYCMIEAGKRKKKLDSDTIRKLALILEISAMEILEWEGE